VGINEWEEREEGEKDSRRCILGSNFEVDQSENKGPEARVWIEMRAVVRFMYLRGGVGVVRRGNCKHLVVSMLLPTYQ